MNGRKAKQLRAAARLACDPSLIEKGVHRILYRVPVYYHRTGSFLSRRRVSLHEGVRLRRKGEKVEAKSMDVETLRYPAGHWRRIYQDSKRERR